MSPASVYPTVESVAVADPAASLQKRPMVQIVPSPWDLNSCRALPKEGLPTRQLPPGMPRSNASASRAWRANRDLCPTVLYPATLVAGLPKDALPTRGDQQSPQGSKEWWAVTLIGQGHDQPRSSFRAAKLGLKESLYLVQGADPVPTAE